MNESNVRPIRKVAIPDHLWEALEAMAREMGADKDALVNQAIFTFARLNGYVTPGRGSVAPSPPSPAASETPAVPVAAVGAAAPAAGPAPLPPSAAGDNTPGPTASMLPSVKPAQPPDRTSTRTPPPASPATSRPPPAPVDSNLRRAKPEPATPPPQLFSSGSSSGPNRLDEDPARREVAERVLETAAELERLIKGKSEKKAQEQVAAEKPAGEKPRDTAVMDKDGRPAGEKALYLMAEDGDLDKVVKDRFLIGRGKHCEFVINSGKVSREHAAIVREGTDYFIEDLGSSNGTWFNKQRIKRRKIDDGDEYYVCSEKIKCVIR